MFCNRHIFLKLPFLATLSQTLYWSPLYVYNIFKKRSAQQRAHVLICSFPKRQKKGAQQLMLLQVSTCFSEPQTFHKCTQGHLSRPFIYNNLNCNLHITGNKLQSIKPHFNCPNLTLNSIYKCSGVYLSVKA